MTHASDGSGSARDDGGGRRLTPEEQARKDVAAVSAEMRDNIMAAARAALGITDGDYVCPHCGRWTSKEQQAHDARRSGWKRE